MNLIDDSRLRQEHTVLRKTLANLVARIDDFGYGHSALKWTQQGTFWCTSTTLKPPLNHFRTVVGRSMKQWTV